MASRTLFVLIAAFWLTMNLLLWRAEYGANATGSVVPVELVWQKMLTAPDNSSLEILHHRKKIGFCRWAANVGEEQTTGAVPLETLPPEGMVKKLTGYHIDLEGNTAIGDLPGRLRFDLVAAFATNHQWREITLRMNLRPFAWEFTSRAKEKTLRFKLEEGDSKSERVFSFADLQNPQLLLATFGGPLALTSLVGGLGLPEVTARDSSVSPGLKWEARNDWVRIGHSDVRVYRLQAQVLDRYKIIVIVSRVGEILRVELPDELVLVNDQLAM